MGKPAQEAGDMGRLAQGAVELEHSGPGANKVHSQQNIHHQQYDLSRRPGDQAHQCKEDGIQNKDGQQSGQAPDNRVFQADMSFKLKPLAGIVPPFLMKDALQEYTGNKLQKCGEDHAQKEEEKWVFPQFRQKNGKKQRPQAIGGREGGAEEAAVEEAAAFQRG